MSIKHKHHKRIIIVAVGVLVLAFLTWLIIGLITIPTELSLVQTYQLPEFTSTKDQFTAESGRFAVALDGQIIASTEEQNNNNSETTESDPGSQYSTASTAKMILGLAIINSKPLNQGETGPTITITPEDYDSYLWYQSHNGTTAAVQVGEELSEYDALMAVFLASANNMADTLAKWAFGSLESYQEYATNMLREWGINDTTIGSDASGYNPSTTSTPSDLAIIGQKVLEHPVLAEIVGTKSYSIPVAGTLKNTNLLLGQDRIIGVKTGYIGNASGYCLVTGYKEGEHIITVAIQGADSRTASFNESLKLIKTAQEILKLQTIIQADTIVGYYDSWWTGQVAISASEALDAIGWAEANSHLELDMANSQMRVIIAGQEYNTPVRTAAYQPTPSLGEKIAHLFGWHNNQQLEEVETATTEEPASDASTSSADNQQSTSTEEITPATNAPSDNCTIQYGYLMLINPNFIVDNNFISARRSELVSLSTNYGINEHNAYNGDNLLDAEAAVKINQMVKAYEADNPGHSLETLSCFRAVGTTCGRLCAATGTSDHHTGLTCDLVDPAYGVSLDTSTYDQHPDWQWLKHNSYKYGFIDRFPIAWAGSSMDEPINVDANGTTGLYETWHYRYVGVEPATEIATGKYNNGEYDSLEHYLKSRGLVSDLKNGKCD